MLFNFDLERTLAGWPTIDQLYIPNLKGKA